MGFPFFPTLIVLFILSIHSTTSQQTPIGFRCTNTTTCNSIVDYKLPNITTLSRIQNLFQIKNLRSLLAVNNLPLTTPQNQSFPSSQIIKIPFPCLCRNGRGISNRRPNYTVVPDDGLFHIASDVFSNLVTYQQIQIVNEIVDANNISIGQNLWIPLPCSCDNVGGEKVVHYGYMVAAGSTVAGIASQFDTTEMTLLDLNGMRNSSELMADSIIDVPLKVCSSNVKNDSMDYPLLVPNDTYTFTANNCVQCQCNADKNWILECKPSGIVFPRGQTCPNTQCVGNNTYDLGYTISDSNCSRQKCSYMGYRNGTIHAAVTQESTCPENNLPGNGSKSLKSSFVLGASLIVLHLLRW